MSKGLLDTMLDESSQNRERSEQPKEPLTTQAMPEAAEPKTPPAWPDDVEQLLELSDGEVRVWLSEVAPNDLLCVVAEGSAALRNRVLGQLDPDSVKWMKGNLELWDPATQALKQASREAVLKVARELVVEGRLTMPDSAAREGVDQDEVGEASQGQLAQALGGLVALARENGREALGAVVDDAGHPMLHFGLSCLVEGQEGAALEKALARRLKALSEAYLGELEMIRQAMLAIDRGEDLRTYQQRLETASKFQPER